MSVVAYLLINAKPGSEVKVAEEYINKKEVKEATVVYGVYDIIMKIEVKTMTELENFILNLRKNKDIEQTSTLISTSIR